MLDAEEVADIDDLRRLHAGPRFSSLFTEVTAGKIADALQKVSFAAGEQIINQGDDGDLFYIIEKGDVIITVRFFLSGVFFFFFFFFTFLVLVPSLSW